MKIRPQFSLRTLLVAVTLLAIWLGYAIPWIQKRHAFLSQPDLIIEFNDTPPTTLNKWGDTRTVMAPLAVALLGDRGVVSLWLPPNVWSPESEATARRLFPEARLMKIENGFWVTIPD
jgi:hypothetical protein